MTPIAYLLIGAAGGVVGSFSTNLGLRLARTERWTDGRSHCDHCQRFLSYMETVPVMGFIRARGRCSGCGAAIARCHLAGEVAGLVLFPLLVLIAPPGEAVLCFVLAMTLWAASLTDLRDLRLPDSLTVLIAACGLALALSSGASGLMAGLVAAAIAFAILQGLRFLSNLRAGEPGLGFGDVKLVTALALWLGTALPYAIALAGISGLLWHALKRGASARMPFGPHLAAAAFGVGLIMQCRQWFSI